MTDLLDHATFAQLCDLLDERLGRDEREALERHRSSCRACAVRMDKLVSLRASARALPIEVEPPANLWSAIQGRVAQPESGHKRPLVSYWRLAAAAMVVAALSSGGTLLIVHRPATAVVSPSVPAANAALSGPARAIDADYASAIQALNETLGQRRRQLDPATVAKVEASLRVIDLAIAEARHALASDPANRTLIDLLAASYERKVELLRRANELVPST
jgi:anti-sigma factor RsiW